MFKRLGVLKLKKNTYSKWPSSFRQSTVEPVFGTPTQFMGMRKINTIGMGQANKCMQLSAIAHNLKKHLKFSEKRVKSEVESLALFLSPKMSFQ